MNFLGHITRKKGLENMTLAGHIFGKSDRGRLRATHMRRACVNGRNKRDNGSLATRNKKWLSDKKMWRSVII